MGIIQRRKLKQQQSTKLIYKQSEGIYVEITCSISEKVL